MAHAGRTDPQAPTPEERAYQRDLLVTAMRWALYGSLPTIPMYLAPFARARSWPGWVLAASALLSVLASAWGLRRVRRGDIQAPTRVMLGVVLLMMTGFIAFTDESLRATGVLGITLTVLLAAALEPPGMALVWTRVAALLLLGALLAPSLVSYPQLVVDPVSALGFEYGPAVELIILVLLGRSTTRHLREALATSQEARAEIERSNAQLTAQRAELQQAEAELSGLASSLDHSNRELQGFARAISADLRAPLGELARHGRSLQEEHAPRLDPLGREYIEGIAESAQTLDALLKGLLAYSSAGRAGAAAEAVDLAALVERVAAALGLRGRAELTLPSDALTVQAHPASLEQIFTQLFDNALKFQAPGGRPAVAVAWADRGDAWELSVRDNGIGLDPRYAEKIFGIFDRLHARSEYAGAGIGLAIVKKAVEEHGGQVSVESEPGRGSTFRFTLPKPEARAAAPALPEASAAPTPAPQAPAPEKPGKRPLRDLALSTEELKYHQQLFAEVLKYFAMLAPIALVGFVVLFAKRPAWSTLVSVIRSVVLLVGSVWGFWRLKQAEVLKPARVMLSVMLLIGTQHMLYREEMVKVTGSMAFAVILLFASALERPSRALRWAWVAVAAYTGPLVLRHTTSLPPVGAGPVGLSLLRYIPVGGLLLFSLGAVSSIRHLRDALATSTAAQRDLEQVHATLERQTAELRRIRASLAALTAELTRSNDDLRRFAYIAAHDLRAPLRALANYSRFLREDCASQLGETGYACIEAIAVHARRMDQRVAALLEHVRGGRSGP